MKVAVLISGLVRTFDQTWPVMRRFFANRYQPDVYIYLNEPHKRERITGLLTPKAILVEPDQILLEHDYRTRLGPGNTIVQNDLRQLYGLMKVNELRKNANTQYDWVIRIRPDVEIFGGLEPLDLLSPSTIYVPRFSNWWGYCDKFAFGPPHLMDIYMDRYQAFHAYFERGGAFHMETFLEQHLRQHHVPVARTNIIFNLLRENGQRDLTWWNADLGDVPFPPDAIAAMKAAVQSAPETAAPGSYSRQPIFAQGMLPSGAHAITFGDPSAAPQTLHQICREKVPEQMPHETNSIRNPLLPT